MVYPETFEGICVESYDKWLSPRRIEIKPKTFAEYDVDIEVECCAVCASDIHTASGGWGEGLLPICVGHEIVGKAIRIGPKVTLVKVGDRVGVGAQSGACLDCHQCKNNNENYCSKQIDTYGAEYPDGSHSQGGYASHVRCHEHFVFKIPDNIPSQLAAPMFCAGATSYSPLVRGGCAPGKRVGIIGLGGIGHFAVLWAKAMGAEVFVISRNNNKKDDAKALGADGFFATDKSGWNDKYKMTFDLIVCCASSFKGEVMDSYLSLLDVGAKFMNVGLPVAGLKWEIDPFTLIQNGCFIGTTHVASRQEIIDMLQLASAHNVKPWVETISISEAGVREAFENIQDNKARYRYTLVNHKKYFEK
ncbi:GroES-like protein [Nadsonia fulvescens var. elongata DSM 6958]|uniref:alcohol dehydrogenase (NADP(+)) n=1 Tax=Nadsonia fulvescens var. elongata DSM 6958 TaxID=857566 RepID=A0A1E3PTC8_9ASCO|nr:GroES-like protein [Nadsonia fulvescens var. elongata DSM 6958]